MPDIYSKVTEAAPRVLEGLMAALELRAADPQQRAMLTTYLTYAALPPRARVLEVGCGTGAVTRTLAAWPGVGEAIGIDPSPTFVARARELAGARSVAFEEADGRSLPFAAETFDGVVFHTTLCHVPEPEVVLREAVRVLRPGGRLAVFEGDYATATLATRAGDPLEACADGFREHFVHDPWLVRRLPALVRAAGTEVECVRSYGYVEASKPGFMLASWVDLGADALVATGRIGRDEAAALKAEARRRVASGEYFGHIAYASSRGSQAGMTAAVIERLSEPPSERLGPLVAESEQAGWRFVRRLVDEWADGRNRFDRPGEACFAALADGRAIGVCGLNVDPYATAPRVGRVRHLYVLSAYRKLGVGQELVGAVIAAARGAFGTLRLRTGNPAAARLYERIGFRPCPDVADCTHLMELR